MKITFIKHSSFMVEMEHCAMLFDWFEGLIPSIEEGKPLVVFASHSHDDHFSPDIFKLDDGTRPVRFVLGAGIIPGNEARPHAFVLSGEESCQPFEDINVHTLFSTDEGVAFYIETEGKTIYHGGDLNWWHWGHFTDEENVQEERLFKEYSKVLDGKVIDVAMVPVDPRLAEAGTWAAKYHLRHWDMRHMIPMHQWNEFDFTKKLLEEVPEAMDIVETVEENGQVFRF